MESIATIGQAVAIISACWAVISGVGAWKREFIGKRRIELAEEVLATFFEIKDAIASIRHAFSSTDEGKTRQRGEHETKEESNLLDRGYIVFERYEAQKEIFQKFNTLKYRFMAAFGEDTEEIFTEINRTLNKIFISSRMLVEHYWQRQGRVEMSKEEFAKHLEEMHKHEGIFWDTMSEEDEVRKKLQKIQTKLEATTKPVFEEPIKTYSILTSKWAWANTYQAPVRQGHK